MTDKDGCRGRLLTAPDDMQKEHESKSKCNASVRVCVCLCLYERREQNNESRNSKHAQPMQMPWNAKMRKTKSVKRNGKYEQCLLLLCFVCT